jgi:hypothetical protein
MPAQKPPCNRAAADHRPLEVDAIIEPLNLRSGMPIAPWPSGSSSGSVISSSEDSVCVSFSNASALRLPPADAAGRKGRFTAEGSNFSEELEEGFLSQIRRLGRIPNHPQTQRIHAAVVQPVQAFEGRRISRLG